MSGFGHLVKSAPDPLKATVSLYDSYQKNLFRIVDLYKVTRNEVLVGTQLAELRKALVVWVFRLVGRGSPGNFALGVGGSLIRGEDHTFLTDLDLVIIPHEEKDQEVARNVQELMFKILEEMDFKVDEVMPFYFDCSPFERLGRKFTWITKEERVDPFMMGMWKSSGAYFGFLMDLQIIEARGKVEKRAYEEKLYQLQNQAVYQNPEAMIEVSLEMFLDKMKEMGKGDEGEIFKVKDWALRPFYNALYASRAKLGERSPSSLMLLTRLQEKGILSSEERDEAESLLRFFIKLRHLIGLVTWEKKEVSTIKENMLPNLLNYLKMQRKEFLETLEISHLKLREISDQIFLRLEGEKNGRG
jgi:hypothetical protein